MMKKNFFTRLKSLDFKPNEQGDTTVEWLGLTVVMTILMLAVVGVVSARGGNQIGGAVLDVMEDMIISLEGGGGGPGSGGPASADAPSSDIPSSVLPSIGVPAAVADGADAGQADAGGEDVGFWGQVGGVFWGIGEGVVDTVVGIGTLAWDGIRVAPITGDIYGWIDPEGQQAVYDKYAALFEAIWNDPGGVLYAMVEPIVTDWNEGRYGEAIGRSIFEVALFFVPGDEAGKAGTIARLDALTPDEMASALARLDSMTPDEAAALLARLDSMTPEELADVVASLDRMTPDELERLGFVCSFEPGTLVHAQGGLVAISDIGIGDYVLGYEESTGTTDYYPVMGVWSHTDPIIYTLTIEGESVVTTPEHPFYTLDGGWEAAVALAVGDEIQQANGRSGTLEAIDISHSAQEMYNLTVAEAHTYFVGEGGWLVHNACSYKAIYDRLNRMTPDEFQQFYNNLPAATRNDIRAWQKYKSRWENFYGRKPLRDADGTYNIHHGFPKEQGLIQYFLDRGIDVHNPQYMYELPRSLHTMLPDGIHTTNGRHAVDWNQRWKDWVASNPNASRQDVFDFRDQLAREFGIEDYLGTAPTVPPPNVPPRIPR